MNPFKKNEDREADLSVYVVFDSKAKSYGSPLFEKNDNVLAREIINMFRNPQQKENPLLVNAEDYAVFKIGVYDKFAGKLSPQEQTHIYNLHDLRAMSEPGALNPT